MVQNVTVISEMVKVVRAAIQDGEHGLRARPGRLYETLVERFVVLRPHARLPFVVNCCVQ